MKFSAVISHPIQHFSPVFRELATRPGVEVRIFYICDHGLTETRDAGFGKTFAWDIPLTDGYDYEILNPGLDMGKASFSIMDSPQLVDKLEKFRPDLIWLHGYGYRTCWRALRWANRHSHTVFFGDSELLHQRSLVKKIMKKLVLPRFFKRCDALLVSGENNQDYYRHYGVPDNKMYRTPMPVDLHRFDVEESQKHIWRKEIRNKFGIRDEELVILFSGKLQDYKRPVDLVEALSLTNLNNTHLLFIGDGPLKNDLENKAEELNLTKQVHLAGFVNQGDIPKYLSAGDIMAMTSEKEPYGLAITESLPFGLPIIASDKIGCVGETSVARPNQNTLVYPVGVVKALSECINRLVENKSLRERFGQESKCIAPTQDVGVTADTILNIARDLTS